MCLLVLAGAVFSCRSSGAKDAPEPAPRTEAIVAATVNGDPIFVGEVDAMAAALTKASTREIRNNNYVRADALRQLVKRRLGEIVFMRDEKYVKKSEVDKGMSDLKAQAEAHKTSLEQFAARQHVGVGSLRHDLIWNIGWDHYREAHLTKSLEAYFSKHHQNYDGTVVRASHILIRPRRAGETDAQLAAQAEKIRADIEDGKITFEEAVKKYSAGPSRAQGGDLGFFPRHGVMTEEFAKVAFNLEEGKLSKPVVTVFGAHLVRVTQVKPGSKQWTETIDQIRDPATLELFEELARQERDNAKVEFTGKTPYLKPGTDELVIGDAK